MDNRYINNRPNYNKEKDPSYRKTKQNSVSMGSKQGRKRKLPIVLVIAIDVVVAALALLIFSLYYFILPRDLGQDAKALPSASQTAESENTVDAASWRTKFADKFTDGAVEKTANSYKSANVNVSIDKIQKDGVTYYVADIYVADIKYFKTAFAKDKYGKGYHESTDTIAKENNAIVAINGDYYANNAGIVVRNGVIYRDEIYKDTLVMNNDGSMQTFTADEIDIDKIKSEGAYQVWTFGPMLLKNGQPMEKFNSDLTGDNPRTAVGYFEPGHYCFVVVDGRQPGYSTGYQLKEMSQLFYDLGCKVAFNLDGGQTSEMAFEGELFNQPIDGGRSVSDILYIADE